MINVMERLLFGILFIVAFILVGDDGCGVSGKLVGTAVIPHGDFAFDPSLVHFKNGSAEIHNASVHAGEWIASLKPDVIFLSTPHGLAADTNFLLYENTNGSGYALLGQDLHNASFPSYKHYLNASLAPTLSAGLAKELEAAKQNVSGLMGYGDGDDMPLRWGEVIPLSFYQSAMLQALQDSHDMAKVLIMSMPSRRYTQDELMVNELLHLGNVVGNYLEALPENVVWMVSADLAHTHLASGPYGYSPTAEPFDEACGEWGATFNPKPLLSTAKNIVDKALSCGFVGMVMLHGCVEELGVSNFTPKLLANEHPTYYGMMVVLADRK